MDINVLRTFTAVCEYGGFSAAAEKLGYTQSTVSSQIRQLENELGTTLFDRFYHHTSLTTDGAVVLQYAKNIIGLQEKMFSELHSPGNISGEIRLAMSSSLCDRYFKQDYLAFRQAYPNIRVVITESGTEQMFDMLRKNEADLVFTLDSHIYDSEYVICAEREEHMHFVAASENPLTGRENLTLEELCRQPFVLTENNMSYRKLLNQVLAEVSLEIHPVLQIGSPNQICSLLAGSELISYLPDFITEAYVKQGSLKLLHTAECEISVWTQLLIHRNKWQSPVIKAFLNYYRALINGAPEHRGAAAEAGTTTAV